MFEIKTEIKDKPLSFVACDIKKELKTVMICLVKDTTLYFIQMKQKKKSIKY